MEKFNIKNHILRRVVLIVMVLAPLSGYSLNLDDEKGPVKIEAIDFREVLNKGSLMGAVLNRGDGTFCGLIVEDQIKDQNMYSSGDESTKPNPSFLAFREGLRKALAQHNIPLCSSSNYLEVTEQMNEALKMVQIFEDPHIQMAGLGRVLFSSPLRAAITSIAGTCVLTTSFWSLTILDYLYPNSDSLNTLFGSIFLSISGGVVFSVAGGTITGIKLGQVTSGSTFHKTVIGGAGGLGTGLTSWVMGQTCFWGGVMVPMVFPMVLNAIFGN